MRLSLLFSFFIFWGCNAPEKLDLNGKWTLSISLQEKTLPVMIDIKEKNGVVVGELYNGGEVIELIGSRDKDNFTLEIGTNYGIFQGLIQKDKTLTGNWVRTHIKGYQLPFTGKKEVKDNLFVAFEKKENFLDITGKWKVQLDEETLGLGVFTQKGSRVQGSILTDTGDYRYLDGYIEKDQLKLYGFDGGFAFIIELVFGPDNFKGILHWGRKYNQEISGVKDPEFNLTDPTAMTVLSNKKPLKLKLKDLLGQVHNISKDGYKDKAKVIQIFGSWCPNCIDETMYFLEWRKNNIEKLNHIEFLAVAFENFDKEQEALKTLRKLKSKMGQDYPILLGDYKTTKSVTKIFPIEKVRAFPTTLFLNKENQVIKVHTGFSGQATGEYFEKFKMDFETTILKLLEK